MAIISTAYTAVSSNVEKMTNWDADLSEYIGRGVSKMVKSKAEEEEEEEVEKNEDKFPKCDKKIADKLAKLDFLVDQEVEEDFNQNADNWLESVQNAKVKRRENWKIAANRLTMVSDAHQDIHMWAVAGAAKKIQLPLGFTKSSKRHSIPQQLPQ